jgi:uncharacterized CHY-type Zn-finger protein
VKKFSRHIEDFVCGHCGHEVKGNGYTNHCPKCLYSKHVDIDPGDRAETCQGLMEPIWVEKKKDKYVITHRCVICGHQKKNKVSPEDDFDVLVGVNVGR